MRLIIVSQRLDVHPVGCIGLELRATRAAGGGPAGEHQRTI
jgi:hypothetical protein